MKFAYADPPYINQAKKHYNCPEIDHGTLIKELESFDGWALSASSTTLRHILSLCPADVRVGSWVKPFCAFKKNVAPAYAWEPVIFKTAVKRRNDLPLCKDFVSANILLQKGTVGAKPQKFCFWLFELLGMTPKDEFDDMFHGSGGVKDAHAEWCANYPEILYRHLAPAARKRFEKVTAQQAGDK